MCHDLGLLSQTTLNIRRGEYVLSATNTNGVLTIKWSVPSHGRVAVPADQACNESYGNLEGPTWETLAGTPGPRWYHKENSVPSNLTEAATEADIRQGSQNMVQGLNNCGYSTGIFNVVAPFSTFAVMLLRCPRPAGGRGFLPGSARQGELADIWRRV